MSAVDSDDLAFRREVLTEDQGEQSDFRHHFEQLRGIRHAVCHGRCGADGKSRRV